LHRPRFLFTSGSRQVSGDHDVEHEREHEVDGHVLDPMLQNFFVRNLKTFVMSYSVWPWQAFTAKSNFVDKASSLF
jgi:hypothetical protein